MTRSTLARPTSVSKPSLELQVSPLLKEEAEVFLQIVTEASTIRYRSDLTYWLAHRVQRLLPHQLLISAFGNFAKRQVTLDIVSTLSVERSSPLSSCAFKDFVQDLHSRWVWGAGRPLLVHASAVLASLANCVCMIRNAIRPTHSLVVHGARDKRAGTESLYIAVTSRNLGRSSFGSPLHVLMNMLVPQFDIAFRNAAPLAFTAHTSTAHGVRCSMHLSIREQQILEMLHSGKHNSQIASTLKISPFTVKNHLKRIFQKIGVSSRTEAATKYAVALHGFGGINGREPHFEGRPALLEGA